jgi:hypothetical protein
MKKLKATKPEPVPKTIKLKKVIFSGPQPNYRPGTPIKTRVITRRIAPKKRPY